MEAEATDSAEEKSEEMGEASDLSEGSEEMSWEEWLASRLHSWGPLFLVDEAGGSSFFHRCLAALHLHRQLLMCTVVGPCMLHRFIVSGST